MSHGRLGAFLHHIATFAHHSRRGRRREDADAFLLTQVCAIPDHAEDSDLGVLKPLAFIHFP